MLQNREAEEGQDEEADEGEAEEEGEEAMVEADDEEEADDPKSSWKSSIECALCGGAAQCMKETSYGQIRRYIHVHYACVSCICCCTCCLQKRYRNLLLLLGGFHCPCLPSNGYLPDHFPYSFPNTLPS